MSPFEPVSVSPVLPRDPTEGGAIRVVSVPAGHPYAQRMVAGVDVHLLPDPVPPGAPTGQWWPPAALEANWIESHAALADVLHIHFGMESLHPDALRAALDAAHAVGWPVIYTMHDIDNPQLVDQSIHHDHLDLAVGAADALITLTPGAAAYARRQWNARAVVIPHPRMLADGIVVSDPPPRTTLSVGIHLKDIRPNVAAVTTVRAAIEAVETVNAEGIEAHLEVWMYRAVRDRGAADAVRGLVAAAVHGDLIEHERLGDQALANAIAALDVCVLPYRHGTHSGWLELCWDLGVAVAAPEIGYYRDQHPDGSVATFSPGSASGLATALRALVDPSNTQTARSGTPERAALRTRRLERRRTADAAAAQRQAGVYRELLGRAGPTS